MSTLVAQTLSNGNVSTSTANCIQGSAKAWVNFNGTGTVAIRASYNVSSITDNGTGDYTVNFTNALPDANYAPVMTCSSWTLGNFGVMAIAANNNAPAILKSTTQLRFQTYNSQTGLGDFAECNVSIFD
jgi:hypothetical protein